MYDPEVDRLDYGFIAKCTDKNELESIVLDLRSGKHGRYAHLEETAEARLKGLFPNSKVLRKMQKHADVDESDLHELQSELLQWKDAITSSDTGLQGSKFEASTLPPVRSSGSTPAPTNSSQGPKQDPKASTSSQRLKGRDWEGWRKYDADAAVEAIEKGDEVAAATKRQRDMDAREQQLHDEERRKEATGGAVTIAHSPKEQAWLADREKDKGNDSFRAGEYKEAKKFYTTSIELAPSVPAYNNRALCNYHLKHYDMAVDDCEHVLRSDPTNGKAFVRKARAERALFRYEQATLSYKHAIENGMSSETVKKEFEEVAKKVKAEKEGAAGKRVKMNICDVDGDDDDDDDDDDEAIVDIGAHSTSPHAAEMKGAETHISETTPTARKAMPATTPLGPATIPDAAPCTAQTVTSPPPSPLTPTVSSTATTPSAKEQGDDDDEEPTRPPPTSPEVVAKLDEAQAVFSSGRYDMALDLYSKALEKAHGPEKIEGLNNKALCLLKLGQLADCKASCTEVLSYDASHIRALTTRARAAEEQERYVYAMADHKRALALQPTLTTALQALSRLRSLAGGHNNDRVEKARVSLRGEEIRRKGNRLLVGGHVLKAKNCYTECCVFDPSSVPVFTNRSLANIKLGLWAEALTDADKALSMEGDNIKALYRRTCALEGLGRLSEAKQAALRILGGDPKHSAALQKLETLGRALDEQQALEKSKPKKRLLIEEVDDGDDDGDDDDDDDDDGDDDGDGDDDDGDDDESSSTSTNDASATPAGLAATQAASPCMDATSEGATATTDEDVDEDVRTTPGSRRHSLAASSSWSSLAGSTSSMEDWVVVKDKDKTDKAAGGEVVNEVPTSAPATYFEFERHWKQLQKHGSVDAACKYLTMVQETAKDYSVLISNQLDADLMTNILSTLDQKYAEECPVNTVLVLEALHKAPRFSMMFMFLSSSQKKMVASLMNKLGASVTDKAAETLQRIRSSYK